MPFDLLRVVSRSHRSFIFVGLCLLSSFSPTVSAVAQGTRDDYDRAAALDRQTSRRVFRTRVEPQWLPGKSQFRYRVEVGPGKFETILVDAERGERRVEDADARRRLGPEELEPLAVERRSGASDLESGITFVNEGTDEVQLFWVMSDGGERRYGAVPPGARHEQHTYAGHVWRVADAKGATRAWFAASDAPALARIRAQAVVPRPMGRREGERRRGPAESQTRSSDGKWRVVVDQHNLWLEPLSSPADGKPASEDARIALTTDGTAEDAYSGPFLWSPSSKQLVAWQTKSVPTRQVHLIESAPRDQTQPKLHSFEYAKPGDPLPQRRPRLWNIDPPQAIPLDDTRVENSWTVENVRWRSDGREFTFVYHPRGHQRVVVYAVDSQSGKTRVVIDEQTNSFFDYAHKQFLHWFDATHEALWMSERDGWNHLYLYDTETGAVKQQVTKGEWVVRGVEHIDEKRRQAWIRVGGVRPDEDPYHIHLARVDLDGKNFVLLTQGDGTHRWSFSPDRRFLVDTWSRVDQPPVTELRSAEDGRLIVELERAVVEDLLATGWRPPERFKAKGRDGKTDIYGIVIRPSNYDAAKKWPVVEQIYAGPHAAHVPKEWGLQLGVRHLAELGFVVVQIDGMGTSHRSKAFHDVAHKNLGDAGFPDRIAWIKTLGEKYPELDLNRVGIYGGSAGGQNALRGLLMHGDFYRAAVADCGCHDNRMDKIWWNELWMGWPVGPHYAEQSNVSQAHRLQGDLLLIVGELDRNVDPASTMQVVDSLVRADKDFELLIIPGAGHGAAESPYGKRRRMDFFVRKLWGREPRAAASAAEDKTRRAGD